MRWDIFYSIILCECWPVPIITYSFSPVSCSLHLWILTDPMMEGYSTIPLIIGSSAEIVPQEERVLPELTHRWRCYVRVQPSAVKSVQFRLHSSFANPVIVLSAPPFEISESGWGEFTVQVRITLFNDEKINTTHYLVLHAESYPSVSERYDSVVYKGAQVPIDEEYSFAYPGSEKEKAQINDAFEYLLGQCERFEMEE